MPPVSAEFSPLRQDVYSQIRTRAYELYEARNRRDGHDVEDWLEAEAEITGRNRGRRSLSLNGDQNKARNPSGHFCLREANGEFNFHISGNARAWHS